MPFYPLETKGMIYSIQLVPSELYFCRAFLAKKLIKMLVNIKSETSCQQVSISGEWIPWTSKVPVVEVETHKVAAPDVVIPTVDTVRHEALLYTWLAEHKPLVLCGPPGSGKTMTLFSALRSLPDMEVNIFAKFT